MKYPDLPSISVDELAQRVGAQPDGNIWSAIILTSLEFDKAIDELREMLSIFLDCEIGVMSASHGSSDLVEQVSHALQNYLLLRDFEAWTQEDWQTLDALRSHLDQAKHGGVLVLSLEATENMLNYAPNFASWVGSRVFRLLLDVELLTADERQARLAVLREWSGKTDVEVIALAEAHQLPTDPEYGEWLILLEREDLLERP